MTVPRVRETRAGTRLPNQALNSPRTQGLQYAAPTLTLINSPNTVYAMGVSLVCYTRWFLAPPRVLTLIAIWRVICKLIKRRLLLINQSEGGGSRNGILPSLDVWIVRGLVLGATFFAHGAAKSCSNDLSGGNLYYKIYRAVLEMFNLDGGIS